MDVTFTSVIPAKAGIQLLALATTSDKRKMDSGFRRNDGSGSWRSSLASQPTSALYGTT